MTKYRKDDIPYLPQEKGILPLANHALNTHFSNALKTLILTISICICSFSICRAETLTASYYSTASLKKEGTYAYSHGQMANGQFFRDDGATCALNGHPLGSHVRVTNLRNGKSVVLVVTDRTAKRFTGKRIDLAISQMRLLDGVKWGLVPVQVERIKP